MSIRSAGFAGAGKADEPERRPMAVHRLPPGTGNGGLGQTALLSRYKTQDLTTQTQGALPPFG